MKNFSIIIFIIAIFCFGFARAQELLAGADLGYGEYLSGECVTCHSQDGVNREIPSINGLQPDVFASILHAYKTGDIDHPVMRMVASRLDEEQIASLAVYFASIPSVN